MSNYDEVARDVLSACEPLPRTAAVAFALRCARRATVHNPFDDGGVAERALRLASQAAASGTPAPEALEVAEEARSVWMREAAIGAPDVACGPLAAEFAARAASAANARAALEAAAQAAAANFEGWRLTGVWTVPFKGRAEVFRRRMLQEAANLRDSAARCRWQDGTPVPESYFALLSTFDLGALGDDPDDQGIVEIARVLDRKLFSEFLRSPARLYELKPREFEELVAELVHSFGLHPVLTKRTRDGGADVLALDNTDGTLKFLIECKRYGPRRRVGVGVVRQLAGVVIGHADPRLPLGGCPRGILATTAWFSAPAEQFLRDTRWLVEGRDFDGIVAWLEEYQGLCLAKLRRTKSNVWAPSGIRDALGHNSGMQPTAFGRG
ncbi:MAG: restriction endonuclease [Deltaproteobacteria bacterium]|nr:restriction endonuclease [Deltaproteobacteria bacterium]MBI3390751.1 restriction endonuclease [Deltaproteobacteria bacterium]